MPSVEEGVIAAARLRASALVRGDVDELRRLLHPQLQWTTRLAVVLDRDAYIAGNINGSIVWRAQRLEEPRVTVVGDTAILTATVIDEVTVAEQPQTFRLRLTQTWVRQGEGWQCIAGHASASAEV